MIILKQGLQLHSAEEKLSSTADYALISTLSIRVIGAPEEIRTPDPQIRSLVLYPAELRALLSP
jgi:hypothetical protein